MSNTKMASESSPETKRRVGPKRSEASRLAVHAAALTELGEYGWRGFNVDRVAKTARASKQTIYRWWRTPAQLAVEATLESLPAPAQTSGEPRERVRALIEPLILATRSGDGAHIWRGALIAAADDEDAGEMFRAWFADAVKKPMRHILAELANRGRIRHDWDLDFAVELLAGPVWHRLIAMRTPVPERYAERLSEAVMDVLSAGAPNGPS